MLPLTQGSAIKWVNCILYWWLCALVDINPCHVQITPYCHFDGSTRWIIMRLHMARLCHITVNVSLWITNIVGEISMIQCTLDKRYIQGLIIALNVHGCPAGWSAMWNSRSLLNYANDKHDIGDNQTIITQIYGLRLVCHTPNSTYLVMWNQ